VTLLFKLVSSWVQLQEAGAKIVVAKLTYLKQQIYESFNDIEVALPPVRGIILTAGVLDDGVLSKQDWTALQGLDPKVAVHESAHSNANFPWLVC
jgi:hypothetical protein